MGLHNGECDYCEEKVDWLFPIWVKDKSPAGGEVFAEKCLCISCYQGVVSDAESTETENDKGSSEDDKDKDDEDDEDGTN